MLHITDQQYSKDLLEQSYTSRRLLLNGLAKALGSGFMLGAVFETLFQVVTSGAGGSILWILTGLSVAGSTVTGLCWWSSRNAATISHQKNRHNKTIIILCWSLIIFSSIALTVATFFLGTKQPMPFGFLTTIMLSLFLLDSLAAIFFSVWGVVVTIASYVCELGFGYKAPIGLDPKLSSIVSMGLTLLLLLVPAVSAVFLFAQLKKANRLTLYQNSSISAVLESIESKRTAGAVLGSEIVSLSNSLNSNAVQQASGSQQQFVAIRQSVTSLEELNQTAKMILDKAQTINNAARSVRESSSEVRAANLIVLRVGNAGKQTVERTIASNQKVNDTYIKLLDLVLELRQNSNQIKEVIKLIKTIANRTHLLSLNAAIEAAGAGAHGDRFSAVAQEVKQLASYALDSSGNVSEILTKVDFGIEQALSQANFGTAETEGAVRVAVESGKAINDLVEAVALNSAKVDEFAQIATLMNALTQEIIQATSQQSSASEQAVSSLYEIDGVAQQNVGGSSQINHSARNLEDLAFRLTQVLAA